MRRRRNFLRLTAVLALLPALGFAPLVGAADDVSHACDEACPGAGDCDGSDARCGCCARVAPAVVPVTAATHGPTRTSAPVGGEPTVAELSVVDRLLDPPRRLVS